MRTTTLCFLVKDKEVLLAMKKRGFGTGKWNGVGGKVEEGEGVEDSAVREIKEEIGVTVAPAALEQAGKLTFSFKDNPKWDQEVHVFVVHAWEGEAHEMNEMRPAWYKNDALPYEHMWVDDRHWLPLVLAGKKVKGRFFFDEGGDELLNFAVQETAEVTV